MHSHGNGLAAKGLHFSHPHRELSIERDHLLVCGCEEENMHVYNKNVLVCVKICMCQTKICMFIIKLCMCKNMYV